MFSLFRNFVCYIDALKRYFFRELENIKSGGTVIRLLIFAAFGPFVFQTASQVIQTFHSQYNIFQDAISSLVFGPYGWVQTGAFYIFGLTLVVLSISLILKLKVKFNLGIMLLAFSGIGFFLIGANQAQLPGAPETAAAQIHLNSTLAVVLLFPLACFFITPVLQRKGHSLLFYYTIFAGTFAIAFFFIGGQILVSRLSYIGLYERIMLWNAELWIEIICIFLIVHEFRKTDLNSGPEGKTGTVRSV